MPRGSKSSYTAKQKRQAAHIEKGYEKRGVTTKTAEARAWATVNKTTGGAKKKKAPTKSRAAIHKAGTRPKRGVSAKSKSR